MISVLSTRPLVIKQVAFAHAAERARLTKAQADIAEAAADQKRRSTIPAAAAEIGMDEVCKIIRRRMLALAGPATSEKAAEIADPVNVAHFLRAKFEGAPYDLDAAES